MIVSEIYRVCFILVNVIGTLRELVARALHYLRAIVDRARDSIKRETCAERVKIMRYYIGSNSV